MSEVIKMSVLIAFPGALVLYGLIAFVVWASTRYVQTRNITGENSG